MEGTLLKWTNYYNGWQPRYFVLNDQGVLAYYKSNELIHEGCKGSCLIVACELKAHPNDSLRFDLVIPGEQFFCLRAKSQPERQKWLVALGTCKSRGTKSDTATVTMPTVPSDQSTSPLISHLSAIDHELKLKVQELRLYETVLMQRIHALKAIANDTATPDVKKLDESTSMLTVTCDGFIQILAECVQLATGHSTRSSLLLSPIPSIDPHEISSMPNSSNTAHSSNQPQHAHVLPKQIVYRTFFSQLRHTFALLSALPSQDILCEQFLLTCEEYLPLLEKWKNPPFISLLNEAKENISELRRQMTDDREENVTLFSLVDADISSGTRRENDCAVNALAGLRKTIDFLRCFLHEFGQGEKSLEEALNKSYGQTLKHLHGWTTRESFAVAIGSMPSNEHFLRSLAIDSNDHREILFERQLLNEMLEHSAQMKLLSQKIHRFYIEHKLQADAFER